MFDIRLLNTDNIVYLTSKQFINVKPVAMEPTASFLVSVSTAYFDQLVARKYEIDSTMTQRMTAIDGESYYTVSKMANVSLEFFGSVNSSFITVQVLVSGMYLVTTNIHCTTRYQVNSTAEIVSNNRTVLYFVCTSDCTSSMTHFKKVGLE
jgi:hypothetical protein